MRGSIKYKCLYLTDINCSVLTDNAFIRKSIHYLADYPCFSKLIFYRNDLAFYSERIFLYNRSVNKFAFYSMQTCFFKLVFLVLSGNKSLNLQLYL